MRSCTGRRGLPVCTKQSDPTAESLLPEHGGLPPSCRSPRSRSRRFSPSSIPGSQQRTGSTSNSSFDMYSGSDNDMRSAPDDGVSSSDIGSESESEAGPMSRSTSCHSADDNAWQSISDTELDSEGDEIMNDISELDAEGPAKPRHTAQTVALWTREAEFWTQYALKIAKKTKKSPKELLLACKPSIFKAYLRWRKKHSRVKKTSSMRAYWKRISMFYRNVTDHRMNLDTLEDICNWIHTLELDNSEKEKLAMFVQDLYPVIHALWVDDKKALHGLVRVVISLLLVLSAATATRPGAIIALKFKDVELMKVRSIENPDRTTILANVYLTEVKNKDSSGKPKKFSFRLEALPCFSIVEFFLALGFFHGAFLNGFTDIQEIFDLRLGSRNVLKLKWKDELLHQPIFCNFQHKPTSIHLLKDETFPYAKYRDIFVRLGRVAGFAYPLELYQLRRASGVNINLICDSVERNQAMGHSGDVYERYYTPTHIARDFQAIYFGSPSEDLLIQSVARMGLSRDRRAPTELNDAQQKELRNDPLLQELRKERELYKIQLRDAGYRTVAMGIGTGLYEKYKAALKKIQTTYNRLHKQRLDMVFREFHDSIDTIEIAKQLSGQTAEEVLTLPATEFELEERASVASMLFKPVQNDGMRVKFVRLLIRLCRRQETRRPKAFKRKNTERVVYTEGTSNRRNKKFSVADKGPQEFEPHQRQTTDLLQDYPIVLPHPICLICIGNKENTHEQRLKPWRKDSLKRHIIEVHFKEPKYQAEFECGHPFCPKKLDGMGDFMRHAIDVHGVCH